MGVKVQLLDIAKRLIGYDKKHKIISNGYDNAYSERVDRFINNSVTAKTASRIMSTYLAGKGFGEAEDKFIVNKSKGITLKKLGVKTALSVSKQRGVFIHMNYNASYKRTSLNILPYTHCRLGEKDDEKYNGKIIVYDNWDKQNGEKINKNNFKVIDVYNPKESVIQAQIDASNGKDDVQKLKNYKGQILYFNLDEDYDYALSFIDPVMHDCDSEAQSSLYKNKSLRKGYFGKTIMITKPLQGKLTDFDLKDPIQAAEYHEMVTERTDFKDTVEQFLGVENVGGVMHIEMEHDGENFDEAIKIENVGSDINDKMFEYTENSTFQNILLSFNNIPKGLVRSDDALFSNNGDSLRVMKETYQENTKIERDAIQEVISMLMENFVEFDKAVEIIPLIEIKEIEEEIKEV